MVLFFGGMCGCVWVFLGLCASVCMCGWMIHQYVASVLVMMGSMNVWMHGVRLLEIPVVAGPWLWIRRRCGLTGCASVRLITCRT